MEMMFAPDNSSSFDKLFLQH